MRQRTTVGAGLWLCVPLTQHLGGKDRHTSDTYRETLSQKPSTKEEGCYRDWRGGSVVKNTCCSSRGSGSNTHLAAQPVYSPGASKALL